MPPPALDYGCYTDPVLRLCLLTLDAAVVGPLETGSTRLLVHGRDLVLESRGETIGTIRGRDLKVLTNLPEITVLRLQRDLSCAQALTAPVVRRDVGLPL